MTDEELIARLRSVHTSADDEAAADRIEALVKERDEAFEELSACTGGTGGCGYWRDAAKHQEARAERLEAALKWQAEQPEAHPFMVAHARAGLTEESHG